MERNFYDNDFEEFLKQKADQYKMYPSDKVWDNIYRSLHGRRRWMILGFTLLFLGSSLFIGRQMVLSNYNKVATQLNKDPEVVLSPSSKIAATHNNNHSVHPDIFASRLRPAHNNATGYSAVASNQISSLNNIEPAGKASINTDGSAVEITASEEVPLVIENNSLPALTEKQTGIDNLNKTAPAATEKPSVAPKNIASKTVPVKTEKDNTAIQNSVAAITPAKPAKWFLQLYGSPIISYRRLLNENQPGYTPPVSASYAGNINKYVHHQPAPGFEFGGKILYKLSNSLSVYAGAQLNYSRYFIDAYKYRVEKASIALKSTHAPDTLSGYTDIRNFSGYAPEQLQNQYWQLSVPIGIEIKLLGQKKLQLNVAGGVQPTFLINSNSYLLSSDYKNYIQSPDLARSFNVHTNFEAFVSYQSGGYKWQLGPQFRSQLLSSYSNQYRVREYLTEFGIKFGITKTIR
ncbi:MAG: hypothetical protein ABJB86_18735 [Bacteroidota bacterium]